MCCRFDCQQNPKYELLFSEERLSIKTEFGYLSPRRDKTLSFMPHNLEWEQFFVRGKVGLNNKKIIKVHYWRRSFDGLYNVGDVLNKYLIEKISNCKVEYSRLGINSFIAIGSMINLKTLAHQCIFWGTGTMALRLPYIPGNKFLGVREPLTRHSLIQSGYTCPDIYGDPALILPSIYNPAIKPKYKLGVVCHWRHKEKFCCDTSVKFIDILRKESEIEDFVDDIKDCEMILSSSLHGIIIANAYGIPARWFILEGIPLEGDPTKKFIDYFSSVQMPLQIPLLIKGGEMIGESYAKYIEKTVDLKINLKLLRDSFPFDEYGIQIK